jgi:hypothetical protein
MARIDSRRRAAPRGRVDRCSSAADIGWPEHHSLPSRRRLGVVELRRVTFTAPTRLL